MEFEQTYVVFGNLQIRYYGIIIVVALLIGAYIASLLAKRSGRDPDHIWGGLNLGNYPGNHWRAFVVYSLSSYFFDCWLRHRR